MNDTDNVLLFAVLATGAVTMVRQTIEKGKPDPKTLVGLFVYGVIIFGISEVNNDIARMLAVVALVTSLAINGTVVFGAIGKAFR